MVNARRYECFCVDPRERWLFAGDLSGQIAVIDIDRFTVVRTIQAHAGTVRALAVHPRLPYLAALANDRCVSLWRLVEDGSLQALGSTSIRDVACTNDEGYVAPVLPHSVALGFHDTERRLVTRSGNGGVLELAFDDSGQVQLLSCVRLHGEWDLQMTRYVAGADQVLSAGRDGCVVLSERGRELRRWTFWDVVAHWVEHVAGTTYLVASDAGRVARIDLAAAGEPLLGEKFARDDMEYVTYNQVSGRAFATSFDRNVYEIDPKRCTSKGVVYSPGYKCIWAKTLERSPATLIVHSRNGGLYKADLDTGRTLDLIKETPDALWSAVSVPGGEIVAVGEGAQLTRWRLEAVDPVARKPHFAVERTPLPMPETTYTKRLVRQPETGMLVMARTDGDIWSGQDGAFRRLTNLGAAVRDIAVAPRGRELFAVTEDGRALKLDLETGAILRTFQCPGEPFPRPAWALAYNPDRNLLAVADTGRNLRILSADDFSTVAQLECDRVKRMRWSDPGTLLYGSGDEVRRYALHTGTAEPVANGLQNTVEDFIWDVRQQYLVVISYQTTIGLFDFWTGARLDVVRDQLDYSKGLSWVDTAVDPCLYPWDFFTWGRSGTAHLFRIHDERIVALGPLSAAPVPAAPLRFPEAGAALVGSGR
jgi:WD40 repeat protein